MLIFGVFVYRAAGDTIKAQMGNKCKGIATAAAALIETDIDGFREFIDTLDINSEYYVSTKGLLEGIRLGNQDNIAFLYVEVRVSDTEMMYVFDAEPADADTFSAPGTRDPLTTTRLSGYTEGVPVVGDFVTTPWGTLLSSYAPIYDRRNGELVGLVGTDISLSQYNDVMKYLFAVIAANIAALSLVAVIALYASSDRVSNLLVTDSLTNVRNRFFFNNEIKNQVAHAKRSGSALSLLVLDIDRFKTVNDTYGHIFGDEVLKAVTNAVVSALRKSDSLSRYGGDEFCICLPGSDSQRAFIVAERIRQAVEKVEIYNAELNIRVALTVSIGIAQYADGQTPAQLIENADKSLYEAKATRNSVAIFTNK